MALTTLPREYRSNTEVGADEVGTGAEASMDADTSPEETGATEEVGTGRNAEEDDSISSKKHNP